MKIRSKALKVVAVFMAVNMMVDVIAPTAVWALTAGPASPDFSSFEPVATTDMVNMFSGDLTYNLPVINIPGPDGAGYSLSLSYHSGSNVEEEASWVGYGWTLNPGAINRSARGFPDEYDDVSVRYYNKTWPNWTIMAQDQLSLEFFSQSDWNTAIANDHEPSSSFPSIDLKQILRYNNYQGFNRSYNVGVGFMGASANATIGASGVTFSADVNIMGTLNSIKSIKKKKAEKKELDKALEKDPNFLKNKIETIKAARKVSGTPSVKFATKAKDVLTKVKNGLLSNAHASTYGLISFEGFSMPSSVSQYKGYGIMFNTSFQINPSQAPIGVEIGYVGNFSMQWNQPYEDFRTHGYLSDVERSDYGSGETNVPIMSDHYLEKDGTFDARDLFIGMPFANYDIYSLSGEGLSGGFRPFHLSNGHYYNNFVASNTTNINGGVELMVGTNLGIGVNFGVGNTKLRMKDWGNTGNTGDFQYDKGAGSVFRFNNDMGGKVEYSPGAAVTTARLVVDPAIPFIKGAHPSLDGGQVHQYLNNAGSADDAKRKTGRSSHVTPIKSGNTITGFEIVQESGAKYRYALPIYTKNEISISVDVDPDANTIVDQSLVYKPVPISSSGFNDGALNSFHIVNGYTRTGAGTDYATAYLLTEITTQDYIDANGNGTADAGDFGGWTKFDYRKVHDAYRWKSPYNGLSYQKGEISRKKDDVGTVSTGEKEVYYLEKVSTKTHTAYFVTNKYDPTGKGFNSNANRLDGLSADISTNTPNAKGTDRLERLEKILLYSNARTSTPIKTVNFAYSYELVPNTPNNSVSSYPSNSIQNNSGRLTLKKVWFDYEGVINARISPYEFVYRYKDKFDYSADLKNKYTQLASFFTLSDRYSDAAQNPAYSPYFIDAWGYTQPYGQQQAQKMRDWRYQGALPSNLPYDPAAYQLKQIKLPSGGEILVEYEEKDYRYVQDRDVMGMVSLTDFDDDKAGVFGNNKYTKNPWYKINLADIGYTSAESRQEILDKLRDYFINKKNRIYFKFLFQLKSDDIPSLNDCRSQYIDGYAKVQSIDLDGSDIKITIDGDGSGYDNNSDKNYPMTPRQACYDYYSTQRVGKYFTGGCNATYDSYDDQVETLSENGQDTFNGIKDFLNKIGFAINVMQQLHNDIMNTAIQPPLKATVCRQLNTGLSYLKIPMLKAKKGGGCRVKRLLTYDRGMETGDAGVVYGSVYHYVDEDGLSSGVASNEPGRMREENPLIGFIPKGQQSWFSRLTVGKDMEQTEGPIGESQLPGAGIGHSRVVVENIHQGISGDGFAIHSFFTSKEFPYDKYYSNSSTTTREGEARQYDFSNTFGLEYTTLQDNSTKDNAPINAGIFSYNSKKFWNTQGFRFIQNGMHGQPKSVEKYSGTYALYTANKDNVFLAFAQVYEYFEPGEMVRMLKKNSSGTIDVVWDTPGKEMDMAMHSRSIKERTLDFALEVDISIGLCTPPPVFINLMPTFSYSENILNTHATTKVISYPVIRRASKVYQDGVWTRTDNLAFDVATGQPVVTRSTDIYDKALLDCTPYDGSVYTTVLPAHWYYGEMGQLAEVDGITGYRSNQLSASSGTIVTFGNAGNPVKTNTFQIPTTAVLDAKIQTFSKGSLQTSWFDNVILNEYNVGTAAVALLNSVYRPHQQYVYKTDVTSINTNKVYKAGVYTSFVPYDFANTTQDPAWIKINEVSRYSPHGMSAEEKDVLEIPSSAKFGYGFTMPTIIGTNVEYENLWFEDYENNSSASSQYAHSGMKSIEMTGGSKTLVNSVPISNRLKQSGAVVRFWLKTSAPLNRSLKVSLTDAALEAPAVKIAQTGEWSLYSAEFSKEVFDGVSQPASTVNLLYNQTSETIFLDDVKFQPLDAQVSCFVYDVPTLRLVVQFDDQHFGMYYQYNDEGKLVRKLVETERGLKTIQESQYNVPKNYGRQ